MRGGQVNPTEGSKIACKTSVHILIFLSRSAPPQTQSHHFFLPPSIVRLSPCLSSMLLSFFCLAQEELNNLSKLDVVCAIMEQIL